MGGEVLIMKQKGIPIIKKTQKGFELTKPETHNTLKIAPIRQINSYEEWLLREVKKNNSRGFSNDNNKNR